MSSEQKTKPEKPDDESFIGIFDRFCAYCHTRLTPRALVCPGCKKFLVWKGQTYRSKRHASLMLVVWGLGLGLFFLFVAIFQGY